MTEEKTYNILCWNTRLYETEDKKTKEGIFGYIDDFLAKCSNPIAVLQEIPYKDKNDTSRQSSVYTDFCRHFSEYRITYNRNWNNGRFIMMTAAVTKNVPVEYFQSSDGIYPAIDGERKNRAIALRVIDKPLEGGNKPEDKFSILGLHASGINGTADIIVGDFNADDYEECENKDVFRTLLSDTHVCILNTPTRECWKDGKLTRKTCIDHIFVRRKYVTKISNLTVHEDIKCSDHYPITFRITA